MTVGLFARARVVCAVAAFAMFAIAVGAQSASAKTLRIQWTANGNAIPIKVAEVKGYYKKYGLDVKLTPGTASARELPSLGKQWEVLTVTATDILTFNAKGGDAVALSSTIVQSKAVAKQNPNLLVEKGVNSLKQLKGKSICLIQAGSGQQYITMYIALAKAGLNPKKDVKWVTTPAPNMLDALRAGRCQAAIAVNPYLNQIKATGQWSGLINTLLSVSPTYTGGIFATSRKLTKKDPKTYRNFQKAYAEAVAYCKSNVSDCNDIAVKELGISQQTARSIQYPYLTPTVKNKWIADYVKPMERYGLIKKGKVSAKGRFVFK